MFYVRKTVNVNDHDKCKHGPHLKNIYEQYNKLQSVKITWRSLDQQIA